MEIVSGGSNSLVKHNLEHVFELSSLGRELQSLTKHNIE